MALQKQSLNFSFGQGLDTKTDPWQIPLGKMLSLENVIFDTGGQLKKRNGFGALTTLSTSLSTTLSTYENNLVALGTSLQLYSSDSAQWLNQGVFQPLSLEVTSLVRSSSSQSAVDAAVASNGLVLSVYLDSSSSSYFYEISDSSSGGQIVGKTALPSTATLPRAHALVGNFVISFIVNVAGVFHLRYLPIPIGNPTVPLAVVDLSSQVKSLTTGYDSLVIGTNLYFAFNGSDGGGAIRLTFIDSFLGQHNTKIIAGKVADLITLGSDTTGSTVVWCSFWDSGTGNGFTTALDSNLNTILAPTAILVGVANLLTMTSAAASGSVTVFYQTQNNYSYVATRSDYVSKLTCTQVGVASAPSVFLRSVGLATKAFYLSSNTTIYVGLVYGGAFQPTYFLADASGNIVAKIAYGNGGGYVATQVLPNVNLNGDEIQFAYLFKDLLAPVNKSVVGAVGGIYSQTGVNLAKLTFNSGTQAAEIASTLQLTGGIFWMYDFLKPVEQNFHLWPEDLKVTTSGAGGLITAQTYNYVATYEWTDGQGNLHRSAPSVPYSIVTTGATSTNTVNIPMLRLTAKASPNSVRVVIYRWSTAQQIFYQITSIISPQLNDPTTDSLTYSDTVADSSISGNLILYTTGGVVENIAPPACTVSTLYQSRLFLVDAEDPNLLWFSKQVLDQTPIEMSDLFTIFIPPTIGAQGNTGPLLALSAMDDKLILFKKDAIYFLVGKGPDNTGNNNDFSDPIFITGTVGSSNPNSLVMTPNGLLFQSDKGIWLLDRKLHTQYVGAPVEKYNSSTVLSAIAVPGTNQVRFTLENGFTLMYDYFYDKWATFTQVPATSSVVFQSLHTYLNSFGQVFQETPGAYLDGSNPTQMRFQTGWVNLAGLQGFERIYQCFFLGQYLSPHFLNVEVAYDYLPSPTQTTRITPDNGNPTYGSDPFYGSGALYGGNPQVEWWRLFFQQQKCSAFQLTVSEFYDSSQGVIPGAGLTLSGMDFVVGLKDQKPRLGSNRYVG